MFRLFGRKRIHEPIAIGAVIACAVSLNAIWILNFLSYRFPAMEELLTLIDGVGTGTGLFLVGLIVYLTTWAAVAVLLRGRDCSEYRDRGFWLFMTSVVLFLVFTFPPFFTFAIMSP